MPVVHHSRFQISLHYGSAHCRSFFLFVAERIPIAALQLTFPGSCSSSFQGPVAPASLHSSTDSSRNTQVALDSVFLVRKICPSSCPPRNCQLRVTMDWLDPDTTRAPRAGEQHGRDYNFVTRDEFESLIADVCACCLDPLRVGHVHGLTPDVPQPDLCSSHTQKAFIEHAQFSGNYYGTSSQAVKDVGATGKRCILDIDSQGVQLVKANHPSLNSIFVFLSPPSLDDLKSRLQGRGSETEESMAKRLAASQAEIAYAKTPGAYDMVIVNDDVERAYKMLKAVTVDEDCSQTDKIPDSL